MKKIAYFIMVLFFSTIVVYFFKTYDCVFAEENSDINIEESINLYKNVQKYALPDFPDPYSKELTLGYVAQKFKENYESDKNTYIETDETVNNISVSRYSFSIDNIILFEDLWEIGKVRFIGGTKKQREALRWGFDNGIFPMTLYFYDETDSNQEVWKITYDADQVITRWQLVGLLSRYINRVYGNRIVPMYYDGGLTDYDNDYTWADYQKYDVLCLHKGIMNIPQENSEIEFYHFLRLDGYNATRDDLDRCLKTLKMISSSSYTAKIIYRKKSLKKFTDKDSLKLCDEILKMLTSMGMEITNNASGNDWFNYDFKYKTNDRRYYMNFNFSLSKNCFILTVGKRYSELVVTELYNAKKVDIVETLKEIVSKPWAGWKAST